MQRCIFILLSLLLWLAACPFVYAQRVLLEGAVVDDDGIEGVHILNKTTGDHTVSDSFGRFKIVSQPYDTLYFYALTHQPKVAVADFEKIEDIKRWKVYLEPLVHDLDEVDIHRAFLPDLFPKGEKRNPGETVSLQGKPRHTLIHLDKSVTGLNLNMEALLDRLNGTRKKRKLKKTWEKQDAVAAILVENFTTEFVAEAVQIPESSVSEFFLYCIETRPKLHQAAHKQNRSLMLRLLEDAGTDYKNNRNTPEQATATPTPR